MLPHEPGGNRDWEAELDKLVAVEGEFDTVEEVDAVYRAQRKLSFTFGALFLLVTVTIPVLSTTAEWWYGRPVWGGLTLNYLVVAVFYHLAYILIALAYTLQANKLEDEMLGKQARYRP